MLGTIFLFWAIAWAVLCSLVASNKDRSAFGWFIGGALFGVFAFVALIAGGRRNQNADKKVCPTCAEMIGSGALQCPHCGHRFAEQTVNLPAGWPYWPGAGKTAEAYCNYCDNMRVFDSGATCQRCGKEDPLLRYYWGFRTERPTQAEVDALRAT